MMGELFSVLDGISPLWWLGFALLLGIIEMAATMFVLIWPALAALVVSGLLAANPNMTGDAQVIWFTVLAVVFTFIGRFIIRTYGDGGAVDTGLNRRDAALVGRTAKVIDVSSTSEGAIQVGDTRWSAVWTKGVAELDTTVRITGVEGTRLKVEIIN
ncbi:MAG: NfeD family protein [Pseudomonadota bacterium]